MGEDRRRGRGKWRGQKGPRKKIIKSSTAYYAQITHSMPYMNLHVARLGADDLALTITGHQLSELIK